MKKFFISLVVIIVVLLVVAYVILFTSFGNNLLKPHIQTQIDKYSPIPISLDVFTLRFGSFDIVLSSQNNINITSNGVFSLFTQNIDGMLNIEIKNPSDIKELTNVGIKLDKNFLIENAIKGKFTNFTIDTISNIADGNFRINTVITSFTPTKILANIENLEISQLLGMAGYKPYASGKLNVSADITGDENLQFTGNATASIGGGSISTSLVKQDFNLTIPNTTFVMNLLANFNGSNVNHKFELLSNVGNINSTGNTKIADLKTDSTYDINISDLSPIAPFVGIPLRGSLKTDGRIVGNSTWMNVDGKSDVASSVTKYSITTEHYSTIKDAVVSIKNLTIEDALYMLIMPIYAKGKLNVDLNLKGINTGINGNYTHNINGVAQRNIMKQEFGLDILNDLPFTHKAEIVFNDGNGVLNTDIITSIAKVNINNALVMVASESIEAPYAINIDDLKKITFITKKELNGAIKATGKLKYSPKLLYADFATNLFGGNINATLNNNLVDIMIKNVDSVGVLDMLQYPQFFNSNINGNVKYDTVTQNGTLDLILDKGAFSANKLTNLLNSIFRFNATKEIYNNIKIDGTINKQTLNANLNMTSNNTNLSSKNAKIDFDNDSIDAYLLLTIKNNELGANIKGKISNPSISLDTKKLGQTILNNVLSNKKTQEQNDKIEERLDKAISSGLNKLFGK